MRILSRFILMLALFLALSVTGILAAIVPTGTDRWIAVDGKDAGDCSNKLSPCASIQYAIKSSAGGDVVHVSEGIYNEDISFIGKAITVRSVNGPKKTIIQGSGSNSVVTFNSGERSSSIINGFSITNGSSVEGGGIYILESSPTISGCIITGNTASSDGGGIYTFHGSPTISSCTVIGNSAAVDGGGIYNYQSSSHITGCTITGNSAANAGGGVLNVQMSPTIYGSTISGNTAGTDGGGVYNFDTTASISDCTISENSSSNGGGIHNESSSATISACIISGNTADYGGGILGSDSSLTIRDCMVSDNSADNGGGIVNENSSIAIHGCTISGNSADTDGGGIFDFFSLATTVTSCVVSGNSAGRNGGGIGSFISPGSFVNCTISGNSASYGGGIYSFGSSSYITNCTIASNSAGNDGGGIFSGVQSSVDAVNSIMWGDIPDEVHLDSSSTVTIEYSDIQGDWPGYRNINIDPLFGKPLPATESPTSGGNYHLRENSPCVDKGTGNSTAYPFLSTDDIDGDPRPQGKGYDLGSDEVPHSLWGNAVDMGSGWRWLDWFGYFNVNNDPWIFHNEHSFLYPFGTSTESVVFWDSSMNAFWWTSDSQYPYVYRFSDGEWLWYQEGSSSPRWFVRLSDGGWESW